MTTERIQAMLAEAVKAKVEKSNALGTKATWTMDDQVRFAARVIAEAVKDEVDEDKIADVVRKTYNHSATAQKLEKAFEKFGHFQRESRDRKGTVEDYMTKLAKELGTGTPTTVADPAPAQS